MPAATIAKSLLAATLLGIASSTAYAGPAFECALTSTTSDATMRLTYVVTVAPTRDELGEAVFVGNAGSAPITVTRGQGGMNFFEFTPSGTVQLLVIALPENLPATGSSPIKYPAVYSRHTILGGGGDAVGYFIPQQFLGDCTLKN